MVKPHEYYSYIYYIPFCDIGVVNRPTQLFGKRWKFAIELMSREIVGLPSLKMMIFHSNVSLPKVYVNLWLKNKTHETVDLHDKHLCIFIGT